MIQLRLTPDQAHVIAKSCRIMSAVYQGHLVCLADVPHQPHEGRDDFAQALARLECYITGQRAGHYLELTELPAEAKLAHDLSQILQSHLSDQHEPLLISGEVAPAQLVLVGESAMPAS